MHCSHQIPLGKLSLRCELICRIVLSFSLVSAPFLALYFPSVSWARETHAFAVLQAVFHHCHYLVHVSLVAGEKGDFFILS